MKFARQFTLFAFLLLCSTSIFAQKIYPDRGGNLCLLPGSVASASSVEGPGYSPASAIDGDRIGQNCGFNGNTAPCFTNQGGWENLYGQPYPQNLRVDFPRAYSIASAILVSYQDNHATLRPEPFLGLQVGNNYGIEHFKVEVLTPAGAWVQVAEVDENYDVIRQVSFPPILGTAVRVIIPEQPVIGVARIIELEAYSAAPHYPPFATASTTYAPQYPAYGILDGEHDGNNWAEYGAWNDQTPGDFSRDFVQVNFSESKTLKSVTVYTLKDDYGSGSVVTDATTFTAFGITSFEIQTSNTGDDDEDFVTVPGGTITGNNHVKVKVSFPALQAKYIRIRVHDSVGHDFSRIVEVEYK